MDVQSSEDTAVREAEQQIMENYKNRKIEFISYDKIIAVNNFRTFDKNNEQIQSHLKSLTEDIKQRGIIEPLKVKKLSKDEAEVRYEIVDGECRWRASKGILPELPCIVMESQDADTWSICANILRRDFNCIELSNALTEYKKKYADGLTNKELAQRFGHTESWARDILRLQDLPEEIKKAAIDEPILPMRELRAYATEACRNDEKAAKASYDRKVKSRKSRNKKEDDSEFVPKAPNLSNPVERGTKSQIRLDSISKTMDSFKEYLSTLTVIMPKESVEEEKEIIRNSKTPEEKRSALEHKYTKLLVETKSCVEKLSNIKDKLDEIIESFPKAKQDIDNSLREMKDLQEDFSIKLEENRKPIVNKDMETNENE